MPVRFLKDEPKKKTKVRFLDEEPQKEASSLPGFIAGAGDVASFGLARLPAALIRTLNEPTSVLNEETFLQRFGRQLEEVGEDVQKAKEESPVASGIGGVLGFLSPGSLGKKVFEKTASTAGRVLPQNIIGRALGTGVGSAALEQGLSERSLTDISGRLEDLKGDVATGSAVDLGLLMAPKTLRLPKQAASSISKRFSNSAFAKQATKGLVDAVEKGKKTLGELAAERGLFGFKRGLLSKVVSKRKDFGEQIGNALKQFDERTVNPNDVLKELNSVKDRFKRTGNINAAKQIEKRAAAWLDNILEQRGLSKVGVGDLTKIGLSPSEANLLKREFSTEASSVFKLASPDAVSSVNAEFANAMSKGLRKEIEKIVPEIRNLNKEFHIYDELADTISKSIASDLKSGALTIRSPFSTGGAATAGAFIGGLPGAIIGGGAAQLTRSFPVQTFLAAQLSRIANNKGVSDIAADMISHPVFRRAILRAVVEAGNSVRNDEAKD